MLRLGYCWLRSVAIVAIVLLLWFSLEPWALRLVPLVFLCAETLLTMLAATRDGGNLAGPLAAVWFACEIRRRHGLYDLSDWDVAGTFLMGLLLILQRRQALGWRGAFAVHTWLAAKPKSADRYTRYEVIGWNLRYGGSAVSISDSRAPDAECALHFPQHQPLHDPARPCSAPELPA